MCILYLLLAGCAHVERPPDAWPQDSCAAPGPVEGGGRYSTRDFLLELSDGVRLDAREYRPRGVDCAGAVVLVPPGFQPGLWLLDTNLGRALAEAELRVVGFSPRGRGSSQGEEDANGALGQDDLASLLRWVADEKDVDASQIVVYSRSFGGALAAGALGRHDDLAVRGWVDFESPAWPSQEIDRTEGQARETLESMVAQADDPDAWWAEREPAGFMDSVAVPYHRLQGIPDHALGDYVDHARAMIDNASVAPSILYNGQPIDPPLTEERAWELAVDGGLEPSGPDASAAILGAF